MEKVSANDYFNNYDKQGEIYDSNLDDSFIHLTITTANTNIDNSNNNSNQITGVSHDSQYGYSNEYLTVPSIDYFNNNDKKGEIYDSNSDDSFIHLQITTANSNIDNSNNNSNQITGVSPDSQYGYFDEYLTVSANDHFNNNDKEEEIYDLNLDDSLKNVLHEIESIPSEFLEDFTSSSSSSSVSTLPDKECHACQPIYACQHDECMSADLWNDFNVHGVADDSNIKLECDMLSISEESEPFKMGSSLSDNFNVTELAYGASTLECECLKCVVNKRESNKLAAVRYRAKKGKERDQLFKECELLAKRNLYLKEKISDFEEQIGFIKSLLMQALANKK